MSKFIKVTPTFGLPLWFPSWETIHDHLNLPIIRPNLPQIVAHFWHPNMRQWNMELIIEVFSQQAADAIAHIKIVPSEEPDIIRWTSAAKGICTSKDAFTFLNSQMQIQLPQQGTRSVSPQAISILKKTWKQKNIPPNIKTFVWRLIRRTLATGERAGTFQQNQ